MVYTHVSVLLQESIQSLCIKPDGIYVDCTLGGGGHAREILCRLDTGRLIGIDQDRNAIHNAAALSAEYGNKLCLLHDNFSNISSVLQALEITEVNGFLLDLGVSSHQLDEGTRGFSYIQNAALDMRMDDRNGHSAYHVVNQYPEKKLADVIYLYGEERYARRIAAAIVRRRQEQPIETTSELSAVIISAMPGQAKREEQHPARRTFQAIRIEVNQELAILDKSLREMVAHLSPGGRICAISFHSLEDRIVKTTWKALESPCDCPRDFPICVCGKKPQVKIISKKPVIPSQAEIERNPRARSAKLRVAEKLIL